MLRPFRPLLRRILAVERTPTYYLPWLEHPGTECVLILNNIEARFKAAHTEGPLPISVRQYDSDGTPAHRYDATLASSTDTAEVRLESTPGGYGFATVDVSHLATDLYVTLSDGEAYAATHGRGEFVERYPIWVRALMAIAGAALAPLRRTIPAFTRHQYVYRLPECQSHLLLMNLSNVTNRIRVSARWPGSRTRIRLFTLRPMGSRLVDVRSLFRAGDDGLAVRRLRLEGNAWFNLYLVGAGARDLAGPLSLMHVK